MTSKEEKIANDLLSRYSKTEDFKQDLRIMVAIDKILRGLSQMTIKRKEPIMPTKTKKVAKTKKKAKKTTKRK